MKLLRGCFVVPLRALSVLALVMRINVPGICQTGNTVVGTGYSLPVPIPATRGQLLTIYVEGVGAGLTRRVQAESLPLPTSLAGISVSLQQAVTPKGPFPVPLLAVFPVNSCPENSVSCGTLTGINLQIPFELLLGPYGEGVTTNSAMLIVSENGIAGAAAGLNPLSDQIHVLRYGDSIMSGPSVPTPGGGPAPGTPVVTHADGSLVSTTSPANPGEALVVYMVGLGLGQAPLASRLAVIGILPPAARVPAGQVSVSFDFRPNAAPSKPIYPGSPTAQAWSVAGNLGLYQVNVVVPQLPTSAGACGAVQSNLTIDLGGLSSYDGAQICVAVAPR